MPSFKCRDVGIDCGFEIRDDDKCELLYIVAMHADEAHRIGKTSALMQEIRKAVATEEPVGARILVGLAGHIAEKSLAGLGGDRI